MGMAASAESNVDGWPSVRQIDDLLDVAGVTKNATTRSDLVIALSYARSAYVSEQQAQKQPTPALLRQLQTSILRTRALLARLKKYRTQKTLAGKCIRLRPGSLRPYLSSP